MAATSDNDPATGCHTNEDPTTDCQTYKDLHSGCYNYEGPPTGSHTCEDTHRDSYNYKVPSTGSHNFQSPSTRCHTHDDPPTGCHNHEDPPTSSHTHENPPTCCHNLDEPSIDCQIHDNTLTSSHSRKDPSIDSHIYKGDLKQEYGCLHGVPQDELSAVDLRTTRPPKSKKEAASVAQLLENFYCNDSCFERNSPSTLILGNSIQPSKIDYISPEYLSCEDTANESDRQKLYFDKCYPIRKSEIEGQNFWNAGTNTEPILLIDKETQTRSEKTKDAFVQTDSEPKIFSYSLLKSVGEVSPKYTCTTCQRVYLSKNSYDRHLRSHRVVTGVRFTTEAKLQVYKRQARKCHPPEPIIIQVSRTSVQCDLCLKTFPSAADRTEHDCIIEPFPMTKCQECHVKFYTVGALDDHVAIVHKKDSTSTSYYCIFCEESFDAGYNFHLHLDKHLYS